MPRGPCAAFVLALALTGLAPTPSFGDIRLSVSEYHAVTFPPDSSALYLTGAWNEKIKLKLDKPEIITLDKGSFYLFLGGRHAQPVSGDAGTTITIHGVSESFSDEYSLSKKGVDLKGGEPIIFDLGKYEVTVTPIASTNHRQAIFEKTLAPAPVSAPEPSSLWIAAVGGAGFAVCGGRRARAAA